MSRWSGDSYQDSVVSVDCPNRPDRQEIAVGAMFVSVQGTTPPGNVSTIAQSFRRDLAGLASDQTQGIPGRLKAKSPDLSVATIQTRVSANRADR